MSDVDDLGHLVGLRLPVWAHPLSRAASEESAPARTPSPIAGQLAAHEALPQLALDVTMGAISIDLGFRV